MSDVIFMQTALQLANQAAIQGEIPVGAVVVYNNKIIACGANCCIAKHDPTAHAEIVALRVAAQYLRNYRLTNCDLYVTLEPCMMCAGAIINARIRRLFIGASSAKIGMNTMTNCSVKNYFAAPTLNHRVTTEIGILGEQCSNLLKNFFQERR